MDLVRGSSLKTTSPPVVKDTVTILSVDVTGGTGSGGVGVGLGESVMPLLQATASAMAIIAAINFNGFMRKTIVLLSSHRRI